MFPLPKRGEEFESAPLGPSLDELQQEVLRLFKAHRPEYLKTKIELELESSGSLVKHCEDCMKAWIEHDDVLLGTMNV